MSGRSLQIIGLAVLLLCSATPGAAALATGAPIAPAPEAAEQLVADTYALAPMRAADPGGGPPWGMATYSIRASDAPRTVRRVICVAVGRVWHGALGAIDAGGVFHPFDPGVGAIGCGGQKSERNRLDLYVDHLLQSRGNEHPCVPGKRGAQLYGVARCVPRRVRTVLTAVLGEGILSASLEAGGRTTPLVVGPGGTVLAVLGGSFTDLTLPSLLIRATLCGPRERRDLSRTFGARRHGCTLTYRLPAGPRPAQESEASRVARRVFMFRFTSSNIQEQRRGAALSCDCLRLSRFAAAARATRIA